MLSPVAWPGGYPKDFSGVLSPFTKIIDGVVKADGDGFGYMQIKRELQVLAHRDLVRGEHQMPDGGPRCRIRLPAAHPGGPV